MRRFDLKSCSAEGAVHVSLQKWKMEQAWPIEQSPVGAEQVLQELGNHVEEGRAPRDGFGAAESLRARAALQFVMMFCGDEK